MRIDRFVLDCNIWISYLITGTEQQLIDLIANNDLTVFSCNELYEEIKRVLGYAHLAKYRVSVVRALKLVKSITVHFELSYPIKRYIPTDKNDDYDEASGCTVYNFEGNKKIGINYRYTANKNINPRQWGIVVSLNNDFNTISWNRNGLWNYYPSDHIGRISSTANAMSQSPVTGPAGPVQKPTWSWNLDRNNLGTNDFRSTKMFINNASVESSNASLDILSNGYQSMRAWKENDQTKVLVAGYSNLSSEGFFRSHAAKFNKPLKQGDLIEDIVQLEVR